MNVRKIRLQQGLSVPDLSKLSGVPVRTIEDLERKEKGDCKLSTAAKLAAALNVKIEELI